MKKLRAKLFRTIDKLLPGECFRQHLHAGDTPRLPCPILENIPSYEPPLYIAACRPTSNPNGFIFANAPNLFTATEAAMLPANMHLPPTTSMSLTPASFGSTPERRLRMAKQMYLRCHTINQEYGYEMVVDKLEILKKMQDVGLTIWKNEGDKERWVERSWEKEQQKLRVKALGQMRREREEARNRDFISTW